MDNLKVAAWLVRYGTRSFLHNLEFVPADRLDWHPEPGAHSALEITGEVVGNFRWCLPILRGGGWDTTGGRPRYSTLAEARAQLLEAADEYAAALEAAGPELDRPVEIAGGMLWAPRAVLIPVLDLLHHHGQICYLQTLLGDDEQHWNEAAIAEFFRRESAEPEL